MGEIVWPLEGLAAAQSRSALLQGGFDYLDWNSYPGFAGDAFHPGMDFNVGGWGDADCGLPVYAAADGVVRYVTLHTDSYGLHVWQETPWGWPHYCHLSECYYGEGDAVLRGQLLGRCGKSAKGRATWPYCHLHFEVKRVAPPTRGFWPLWTLGYTSPEKVDAVYVDPGAWLQMLADLPAPGNGMTEPTYQEVLHMLTDEQAQDVIRHFFGKARPFDIARATDKAFLSEWRQGRWRGLPKTGKAGDERLLVTGGETIATRLFEPGGVVVWKDGMAEGTFAPPPA